MRFARWIILMAFWGGAGAACAWLGMAVVAWSRFAAGMGLGVLLWTVVFMLIDRGARRDNRPCVEVAEAEAGREVLS